MVPPVSRISLTKYFRAWNLGTCYSNAGWFPMYFGLAKSFWYISEDRLPPTPTIRAQASDGKVAVQSQHIECMSQPLRRFFITAREIYDLTNEGRELILIAVVRRLQDPHFTVFAGKSWQFVASISFREIFRIATHRRVGGKRTNLFTRLKTRGSLDSSGMADFFHLSFSTSSILHSFYSSKTVNREVYLLCNDPSTNKFLPCSKRMEVRDHPEYSVCGMDIYWP